MHYGTYQNPEADRQERDYQKAIWRLWSDMRDTEQRFFVLIARASNKGREWITREQIADMMNKPRLIPYYLKLLDHLCRLGWVEKSKRPHFRRDYEGKRRPAGYEWIYRANADVIEAILEADPNKPAPKPLRPPPPEPEPGVMSRLVDKIFEWLP